jgi:nucleoside-diphosphate-sugar epimerase
MVGFWSEIMTSNIAITGATGFVGRTLLPILISAGHRLAVLARNPSARQFDSSIRVIKGDLQNTIALSDLTRNADVVLHVAGAVSGVRHSDFMIANLDGTVALAKAAKANGVRRFVYVSSLAAREPSLTAYGESKAAAEQALLAMAGDMEICILCPAAVYGPGDTATLPLLQALLSNTAMIPGSKAAVFAMVHVEDVARALAVSVDGLTGRFELHDGSSGHSWSELIAITRMHFGTPARVVFIPKVLAMGLGHIGDIIAKSRNWVWLVGTQQIKQIYHPDWRVKGTAWILRNPVQLQDGLPQTIRWYQAQGLLPQRGVAGRSGADSGTTG